MEGLTVKEEEVTITCNAGPSVGVGSSSSSASSSFSARPMEGLHEMGPPPFLTKTFDMGFRKVDPDRWEFANEGFLGGQKHLLRTIKRRRNIAQNSQQQGGACVEIGHYGIDGEMERLKRDRNVLMTELVKLRQQQQFSRDQIRSMEARLQSTEKKQQQMMTFLAKALTNPAFVQNLMHQKEQSKMFQGIEVGRKRRLTASPSTESLQEEVLSAAVEATEGLATVESEIETLFSAALDDESSSDIKEPILEPEPVPSTSIADLGTVGEINWDDLLNEDLIAEGEGLAGEDAEADRGGRKMQGAVVDS
ncbi:Heat shock factor protein HSF30 [Bienertia sinuspersici]